MDRRENGIVLVFEVSTSPANRRIGWIEGQLGKEPLAGSIARCNLPQLRNVCSTRWRVIIYPVEMWGVPFLYQLKFPGPCRLALPHLLDQLGKGRPVLGCGLWHFNVVEHISGDRKSTRLNSSHQIISYAVFCLKKKNKNTH